MLDRVIRFFLTHKFIALILCVLILSGGLITAPFDWNEGLLGKITNLLPRSAVKTDAIPDLGENQQIIFTNWPGRSPQDIEDQITYPLTSSLMGIAGVKTIRSHSIFGFSSIYIVFEDGVDFFDSRTRILEKLETLPPDILPDQVQPVLGPDATALGQVFWYTLEGRDEHGKPAGGWDLHELRSLQDYFVKQNLSSVKGVSEVASVGGFVKEYQIELDPVAMKAFGLSIDQVMRSVSRSNQDIGARTIEVNRVEYVIRALGYVKSLKDIEEIAIISRDDIAVKISQIAKVRLGPASRRGVLDKSGAEAVGGVVVARNGANPMEVIAGVKAKIKEISQGLPEKKLANGSLSKIHIVPFYDRSKLIGESLNTLEKALTIESLVTMLVILLMVWNLRATLVISGILPLAILLCFSAMKVFDVEANIVALAGIAIAIGTLVDVGIILTENMIRYMREKTESDDFLSSIFRASKEVMPAIITAILTTILSFLPVFMLEATEGKLFRPLAFTKTFVLLASLFIAIFLLPAFAHFIFSIRVQTHGLRKISRIISLGLGTIFVWIYPWQGAILLSLGIPLVVPMIIEKLPTRLHVDAERVGKVILSLVLLALLTINWMPLGWEIHPFIQTMFVGFIVYGLIGLYQLLIRHYAQILNWCLKHKKQFLIIPAVLSLWALLAWQGFGNLTAFFPQFIQNTSLYQFVERQFPGFGKEFMPALDEGEFLLMPNAMPHAGMEENQELLQQLDMAVQGIPEVEEVVGKLGRVESALDPAPVSMFENVIRYKSEYKSDEKGNPIRFRTNDEGEFVRDENHQLITDPDGDYFRQWRDHIRSPEDIWKEIASIRLPGVTAAPKLQPIETRLVMLQTGIRSNVGIKIQGPHLDSIQAFGLQLEELLKEVDWIDRGTVFADRLVAKPYLEIDINRQLIARYGLHIADVQQTIAVALGGIALTHTVEGRERYPVRVRYARELRDNPGDIENLLIPTPNGKHIPLKQLAEIRYRRGPQVIKGENSFLTSYVLLEGAASVSDIEMVELTSAYLAQKIEAGELYLPTGCTYSFAGSFENQLRAEKRLRIIIPIVLLLIMLIIYMQFKSLSTTLIILSGIWVAICGGFIWIWFYNQAWFMDISLGGIGLRELFHISPVNMSVAVWVGFIALIGIATDDGVVIATYIRQRLEVKKPTNRAEIHQTITEAGQRRIRPCLMTTATTLLALLPILTSDGRGADIMLPMAIPIVGGMVLEVITLFVVPVLYAGWLVGSTRLPDHDSELPPSKH